MKACMEEARLEATANANCPRKLDFNLPLLSTRRLGGCPSTNSRIALQDTSNGIPFCWEHAPGKPKNVERNDIQDGDTPRPRLPPCRWQPQNKASPNAVNIRDYHYDDGCDADIDDDGDDQEDVFSDAVEVLSLTEAIDIVQKAEDDYGLELDRLNLESVASRGSQSPNFMMERFLPDATALAASALYASKNLNKKLPFFYSNYAEEEHGSQIVGGSYGSESSHKGCGLEILFPWRMKHKLCGVKSPVRQASPNVQSLCTARQKKHCSINRSFCDVKKTLFN